MTTTLDIGDRIIRRSTVNDYYKQIFNECDKNDDGSISIQELRTFVEDKNINLSEEAFSNICQSADQNQDGRIDFSEFVELLNNPHYTFIWKDYVNQYISYMVVPRLKRQTTVTGLYEEQYKCKRYTISMITISLLQISLFYIQKCLRKNEIRAALKFNPEFRIEIWRFVTYMLIHEDQFHLYFNVLIQLLIGLPLEMVHTWRVSIIYLAGVLAGSLASSVLYDSGLVGASAGVCSFYTAHIASVIMNWREMTYPCAQLLLFGTLTFFDPIYNFAIYGNNGDTSYLAHLAGAVAGLLVGVNILKNIKVRHIENVIWWTFIIIYTALMGYAIGYNIMKIITEKTANEMPTN